MYNNDTSKNYSNNSVFLDIIDKVNITAKGKGFINGRSWLLEAQKLNEISHQEFNEFQSCHFLRNSIAHGWGGKVIVTDQLINVAQSFLSKITVSQLSCAKSAGNPKPVIHNDPVPVEPAAPDLKDLKNRAERLKLINDPTNAVMVEIKKTMAEGLKSFKEYSKLPKDEIAHMVVEYLCTCSKEEFEELQKTTVVKAPPAPPPPPVKRTIFEVKQITIKNLMSVCDQTTRKVCKGLGFLVKKKYEKEVVDIVEKAKKDINSASTEKEIESIYVKATEDLVAVEPKVKY